MPDAVNPAKLRLRSGIVPVLPELVRLGGAALLSLEEAVARTRAGSDPEDLHEVRVALRRLRVVLALAGHALGEVHFAQLALRIRDAYATLGEARDWSVLQNDVLDNTDYGVRGARSRAWRPAVAESGARAARRARRWLGGVVFRALLSAVKAALAEMAAPSRSPTCRWLTAALVERAIVADGRLRRRLERLLGTRAADARRQHAARRLARRLRDWLSLIDPAAQPRATSKRYFRRLNDLQGALGQLNDLNNAVTRFAAAPLGRGRLPAWLTRSRDQVAQRTRRCALRFLETPALSKPRAGGAR